MALIGKLSNKPTTPYLNPLQGPSGPLYRSGPETTCATTSQPLLAAWWNHERDAGTPRELWAVGAVLKEMSKGANYVIWPLAIFGMLALRRRFAIEPGMWVLVVLIACNVLLLTYLAARVGYVSERHTVLLTLIACIFAAAGLPLLAAGIGQLLPSIERMGVRFTAAGILVALIASSLPFTLKPMHPHREGHKHAGLWLAKNIKENEAIVDPFCWAEWYAGRTLYRTSWNPDGWKTIYIVWEHNAGTPHSRLPNLPVAEQYKNHPRTRLVYHWPESIPAEQARVHVYRLALD
jgi:hypothetical protein